MALSKVMIQTDCGNQFVSNDPDQSRLAAFEKAIYQLGLR